MYSNSEEKRSKDCFESAVSGPNDVFSLTDRIELLAEGELTQVQQAGLFQELDQAPGGWRDLAMALIEHRNLRLAVVEECRLASEENAFAENDWLLTREARSVATKDGNRLFSSGLPLWRTMPFLRIACGLIMAFVLGWMLSPNVGPSVADSLDANDPNKPLPSEFANNPNALTPAGAGTEPITVAFANEKPLSDAQRAYEIEENGKENQIVGYAKWIGNYGPQSSPVFLGKSLNTKWSATNPPKLHPAMQQKFDKAGVVAQPMRRFVSLELEDGPLLTIPLDEWRLRHVGRETF